MYILYTNSESAVRTIPRNIPPTNVPPANELSLEVDGVGDGVVELVGVSEEVLLGVVVTVTVTSGKLVALVVLVTSLVVDTATVVAGVVLASDKNGVTQHNMDNFGLLTLTTRKQNQ